VEPEWPTLFREDADNPFELAFKDLFQIGPWLKEVLEICCGEYQHLASAIQAKCLIALVQFRKSSISCFGFCVKRL
jgi:hypothetical protein